MIEMSTQLVATPGGIPVVYAVRDGTNDAGVAIALNVWNDIRCDEYRMTGRALSGWAIDVGAHIGAFAVATALDHPDLRVLAVEAVPENAALIAQNATRAGVIDRVIIVQAAAAAPGTSQTICHYGYRHDVSANDGYLEAHRFVAETWGSRGEPEFAVPTEAVSLDLLMARYGIGDVALLKIDCEGCEWAFLDSPAVWRVETIVGEYHGGITGVEDTHGRLEAMLQPTHDITYWNEELVIGLFEAVRR